MEMISGCGVELQEKIAPRKALPKFRV